MRYVVFYTVGEYDKYAEIKEFDNEKSLLEFVNSMQSNDFYLEGCYRVIDEIKFKPVETVTKFQIDDK